MKYIESPLHEIDHLHIRLYSAEEVRIDERWACEDVCSTYWRFYVNSRSGASALLPDGTSYPLPAWRIHFIPAWVRWSCHNVRPIEHLYAHFDLVGLPGSVVRACWPGPVTLPADPALERSCEELRPILRPGIRMEPAVACHVKAVLFACLGKLFANLSGERAVHLLRYARGLNPVAQALQHIDEHLAEDLPNSLLATRCGFSSDHFARLFRLHLGQTPAQYVLERRIAMAAEQLAFSTNSIEHIASTCGFPDRFYFSRMFKRRMGQAPASYRRTALR